MNGIDIVADTNFLIALHEGNTIVKPFLDQTVAISVISEIELLGYPKITEGEKRRLKALLAECEIVELTAEIKELAIALRQTQRIKVPDSIIAATAIYLRVPVVTSDLDFKKLKDVTVILFS